jgi:hypothetical protein
MEEFTFTKSTAERYDIRPKQGFGWGIFTIDENGGVFHCQSDYGDYSYIWSNHGRESFKHFLCEIDTYYLLKKVAERDDYDHDKCFKKWEKAIIKLRRERDCTKEQARDAWDFIHHELEHQNSYDICCEKFSNSEAIEDIAGDEWWCTFELEKDYSSQAIAFAHKLWPMFIQVLKQEIDAKSSKPQKAC